MDAYLALQIASGRLAPTPEQSQCSDVNGNGRIDSADASMILYYAAHGYWPTVEQDANLACAADVSPLAIKLNPAVGAPGSTVAVTLRAENMPEMAGGEFVIAYNRMLIDAITVQPAGLASGFKLEARDDGAGLLHIALADAAPISGAGALAILHLHLASNAQRGDVSSLVLSEIQLNDIAGATCRLRLCSGPSYPPTGG